MYSVHAYYHSVILQGLTLMWIYPIIVSFCSFYCFQFDEHTFADLMVYTAALALIAAAGGFFGMSVGTMTDD